MDRYLRIPIYVILALLVIEMAASESAIAQSKRDSLNKVTHRNWRQMLDKLAISLPDSLPPPANDPNRPAVSFRREGSNSWIDSSGNNYARGPWGKWTNYDTAKANPYKKLTDALTFKNGQEVGDSDMWWDRKRPEIKQAFSKEVYGFIPENVPEVNWKVVNVSDTTIGSVKARRKDIVGKVDNSVYPSISVNIDLSLITPGSPNRPVPVIMHYAYQWPPGFEFPENGNKTDTPDWKQQILEQGWGYAIYKPQSVQPDHGAGLNRGIIGLTNKGKDRDPKEWGALRAWAWGASRALDYLETDADVADDKVGLEGLSRFGKAVLVTMAYDDRFAIAFIGSSGKGGAALYRRNFGETIGILASSGEYHWFSGNFLKYAWPKNAKDLSVDSHELIAMCAPRPVFISVGSPDVEGTWVDSKGQFMAAAAAGPVYELLGAEGLGTYDMPDEGTALISGEVGFRQHEGGHTVVPNWPYFIRFAMPYLNDM